MEEHCPYHLQRTLPFKRFVCGMPIISDIVPEHHINDWFAGAIWESTTQHFNKIQLLLMNAVIVISDLYSTSEQLKYQIINTYHSINYTPWYVI